MDTKHVWIGFLVFVLILAVIGVGFVMISGKLNPDKEDLETTDTVGVLGNSTNTEDVSNPTDTGISSDTTVSTAKGHVLKLGDDDLRNGYIVHDTNGTVDYYYCGFYTTALKANTKYRVSWTVNTSVDFVENVEIRTMELDGVNNVFFVFNTSYDEFENNVGTRVTHPEKSKLFNNSWEFTTENAGDMVTLWMFQIDVGGNVTDLESAKPIMKAALDYVTSITFEEIVEG